MVVEPQRAWGPHLRSRARVRTAPKQHFVDPSLAIALLSATADDLIRDLSFFGTLFESLAVRDLRIYAGPLEAEVAHYRDSTGLEVDAIVTAGAGKWAAFEVKLGASGAIVDAAAKQLLAFADRIDAQKTGKPRNLVVIVGTGPAYTRPDGVLVAPIGTLGP
jgi:predicted AAA+ superfamily ATPase